MSEKTPRRRKFFEQLGGIVAGAIVAPHLKQSPPGLPIETPVPHDCGPTCSCSFSISASAAPDEDEDY